MSGRLIGSLTKLRRKLGGSAQMYGVLGHAVGRHPTTVKRWIKSGEFPEPFDVYEVARQCGLTEKEAHEEMLVCFPEMAGKSA